MELDLEECIYCDKEFEYDPDDMRFVIETYSGECCGEECYAMATEYIKESVKFKPVFLVGIVGATLLLITPLVLEQMNFLLLFLGWVLLGIVFVAFPALPAQAIEVMGIKKGVKLSKRIGLIILFSTPIWFFVF